MSGTARGHIVIRRKAKDGADGSRGAKLKFITYASGQAYQSGAPGEEFYHIAFHATYQQFFTCIKSYPASETHAPTQSGSNAYWQYEPALANLFVDILCANEAFLNDLVVRHLYTTDGKTQIIEGGLLKAVDGIFSGTVNGITGSFRMLNCVDNSGNVVGSIRFGNDGTITFEGDLYAAGYNQTTRRKNRLFTSNHWCQGSFGAYQRNAVVVNGSYAYYYLNGLTDPDSRVLVYLASGTDSSGNTYYRLPLYGGQSSISGFPVDLVIINVSGTATYRYVLETITGKKFTIINTNDDNSNIYYYKDGYTHQLAGGVAEEIVDVGYQNQSPKRSYIGSGLMIVGRYDNDWE